MSQNEIMYLCKVLTVRYTENIRHDNIFCISLIHQNSYKNECQDPQAKVIRGWTRIPRASRPMATNVFYI